MARITLTDFGTPLFRQAQTLFAYAGQIDEFIARRIMGKQLVSSRSGQTPVIDDKNIESAADVLHTPGTAYPTGTLTGGMTDYSCHENGHEVALPESDITEFEGAFDVKDTAGRQSSRIMMIAREDAVGSLLFDETGFTAAGYFTDISATAPLTTNAGVLVPGSAILTKIDTAITTIENRVGSRVDAVVMSAANFTHMTGLTEFKSLCTDAQVVGKKAKQALLADILGVDEIILGRAKTSLGAIWSDKYIMPIVKGKDGIMGNGIGNLMIWEDESLPIDDLEGDLQRELFVEMYKNDTTRSLHLRVREFMDEIAFPKYGQLIQVQPDA